MRRRLFRSLVVASIAAAVGMAPAIAGVGPTPIKTTNRSEIEPSGNASYFAWTQNSVAHPRRYRVWFEPNGGPASQVPTSGFAFAGRMDRLGTELPYWWLNGNHFDIGLFDMGTESDVAPPPGVNTRYIEWLPARDGTNMTFVRLTRSAERLYLVTDLTTGDKQLIQQLDADRATFANTPNLVGDYITWAVCTRRGCEAYRYQISTLTRDRIPNPNDRLYFAPAPDLAGNVYFEQSGFRCGRAARLMKWTGAGDPTPIMSLGRGNDVTSTAVYDDGAGGITFFFDIYDCSQNTSDLYSLTNP